MEIRINGLWAKVLLVSSLSVAQIQPVFAMGAKKPSQPSTPVETPPSNGGNSGVTPPSEENSGQKVVDLALTLAIVYAKSDPRYATILNTLGINSSEDLRNLLKGNSDGTNIRNIVARLAMSEAQKRPEVAAMLVRLGITDEASLREFLKNSNNGGGFELILGIAFDQAKSNPKYARWLSTFQIDDIQDLRRLLDSRGNGGNIQSLILFVAMNYVESNPKYAQYAPIIEAAMIELGLVDGSDGSGDPNTSDDDIIDIGPYRSMTVGEVKAVRAVK